MPDILVLFLFVIEIQDMRRIFVLVLSVLAVLATGDGNVRAETIEEDFGWSEEVDAALVLFENGGAELAAQQLTLLADAGDSDAQFLLGRFYGEGIGISEDDCRSLRWYQLAAKNGHVRAIEAVGDSYESGSCVEPDIDAAVQHFERATALGNSRAALSLA